MNKLANKEEIKKVEKKLKELTGGFFPSSSYQEILEKHNIPLNEGSKIKDEVKKEIKSEKISSSEVEDRLIDLLVEYTDKKDKYVEKSLRFVDALFETTEIKKMIEISGLTEEKTLNIKNDMKRKIKEESLEKYDDKKIKSIVENKLLIETINFNKEGLQELKNEWVKELENLIKDFCPDIELTDNEIRYIKIQYKNFENIDSIVNMKELLNEIAEKIISNRYLIGKYESAGVLIEDGGLENTGAPQNKRVKKANDIRSDVFIKINDDKLILTETNKIDYFNENPIFRKRTFFFKDIVNLNKGIRTPIIGSLFIEKDHFNRLGVELNLINTEKLRLYFDDEENVDLLCDKWEAYKENQENELSSSLQESNNSIGEDILKYAELYEKGLLTEEEFNALKKKLLGL